MTRYFLLLHARKILLSTVLLLLVLPGAVAHAQESQWGSGKALYDKVCGHCHKPEVGIGPVIEGRALPAAYLKVIVRQGLNAMPAFPESHVDDASIEQIAEYLASLPPPAEQP